ALQDFPYRYSFNDVRENLGSALENVALSGKQDDKRNNQTEDSDGFNNSHRHNHVGENLISSFWVASDTFDTTSSNHTFTKCWANRTNSHTSGGGKQFYSFNFHIQV